MVLVRKNSTINQLHRITNIFQSPLEEKRICSVVLLDVSEAIDNVWHRGLEYEMENYLSKQHSQLLKSYIVRKHFRGKREDSYSDL